MSDGTGARFEAYADGLASVLGGAVRAAGLKDYCTGLMLPLERKSVEPLAAATSPARVSAQHQSLMHFVSVSPWSDEKLLAKVRALVLPVIERHGPIEAWIIDDTGFRKQGRHSVGVARQYLGEIGKQDNCQVAVSLSLANAWASLRWRFSSIFRRIGPRMGRGARRRGFPRRSPSPPSPRSPCRRSAPRWRRDCREGLC